jgi:myo-inositol-1(or 4)-monophosphatase|tara:strand:+ start:148 stop:942 length:795 start_codon:yes stop_codon:yes gene_type:complete
LSVDDLQVAIKAVIRASEIILEAFGNPTGIEYKSRVDVVTATDKLCEEEIVRILRSETPDYGIIGEEGTNIPGEKVWIVDPLDGTTNFSHSYPFCGPSIGLCEGNTVLVGVLANPLSNELFFASKNQGSYMNDLYNKGEPTKLQVTKTSELHKSLFSTGFPHNKESQRFKDMIKRFIRLEYESHSIRKTGSAALSLAYVAAGRIESYVASGQHSWDMAGGILLVEEAGGKITNFEGEPYTMETREWLVTNRAIHDKMVELLKLE